MLARVSSVTPNLKARVPSYLLSLSFSPELHTEHSTLHKKPHYTSSAQLTVQHTVEELTNALLLTVINFPRKQIGSKMSDCLVTGVQPIGVSQDIKREQTVCVRPFALANSESESDMKVEPGTRVGVLPQDSGLIASNPRDLIWEEFAKVNVLVGRVKEELMDGDDKTREKDGWKLHRFVLDFGPLEGERKGAAWLKTARETGNISSRSKLLLGRQVLAITNVSPTSLDPPSEQTEARGNGADTFSEALLGVAAILTVGGEAVLEPAKTVGDGHRLA